MQELRDHYKKEQNIHHAYLIEGVWEHVRSELLGFFEKDLSVPIVANPDFYEDATEAFSISQARLLKERAVQKSLSGNPKLFLVSFDSITTEAQNSLLKIFEEPAPQTHFFVVVQNKEMLLPTVRSRMMLIRHKHSDGNVLEKKAQSFLASSKRDRLEYVQALLDEPQAVLQQFLNALEEVIYTKEIKVFSERGRLLNLVEQTRGYLQSRAMSKKIALEYLALSV